MINEHPLLASYSNIFVIVRISYLSLIIIDVPCVEGTSKINSWVSIRNHILMEGLYQAH